MYDGRFRRIVHTLGTTSQGFAVAASGIVGAAMKTDPMKWGPFQASLERTQASAWWILSLLSILGMVSTFLKKVVGRPAVWDTVHAVLDKLRELAYTEQDGDSFHHHRVTLFRHHQVCLTLRKWPWSGWLTPVSRSGHTTQKTGVRFCAPDDAERAEGVAGVTWAAKRIVLVDELPDLHSPQCTEADFELYAKKTGSTPKWTSRFKPRARSYVGIPVEVKGRVWGVIVMDSKGATNKDDMLTVYRSVGGILSKILEGA